MAGKRPGKHHDGGGLGLCLRVEPNGARFWVQRIAIRGKRRELGLGRAFCPQGGFARQCWQQRLPDGALCATTRAAWNGGRDADTGLDWQAGAGRASAVRR